MRRSLTPRDRAPRVNGMASASRSERAQIARPSRRVRDREHRRRQHQMRESIGESAAAERRASGRRQPAERVGEDELEHEAEPEHRQRDAGDGERASRRDRTRARAADAMPTTNAISTARDRRRRDSCSVAGTRSSNRSHDRPPVGVAVAPVAAHECAEPRDVLSGERTVESHRATQSLDVLRPHVGIVEIERERSAGRRVNQREDEQRDDEQQRDRLHRASHDESSMLERSSRRDAEAAEKRENGSSAFRVSASRGGRDLTAGGSDHSCTFQNGPAFVGLPLKFSSVAGTASIFDVL